MLFKLPQSVKDEIKEYKEYLNKYLSGEMSDAYFKGIRVPFGFYSQRGGKVFMARIRIPGGILTPLQLLKISQAAKNFASGELHITTRQDIQIHNLPLENSGALLEFLAPFDLSPRGGGGNTVRNVTACPFSGICEKEKYPVYKLAISLTEYLLTLKESYNLPRKFKISFSGCEEDCAFAGVNDVGIVAMDGGKFKVLAGGGMGAKSAVGRVLEESVELEDVPYVVRAVYDVFYKYGDRRNRHHNRLRFFIEDNGWERFVELYKKELANLKRSEHIFLRQNVELPPLPHLEENLSPEGLSEEFLSTCLREQKQKGYYTINLRIINGNISSEEGERLSSLEEIVPEIIFRTTQSQNLSLTNIPARKIKQVFLKLKDIFGNKNFFFPDTILDVKACRGSTTCNLGLCNSPALCEVLTRRLEEEFHNFRNLKDVRIFINGCPNACGQHPVGLISLSGMTKKVYGYTVPFFKVHILGKVNMEKTNLAEEAGQIPGRAVPEALISFLKEMAKNVNGMSPEEYLRRDGMKVLRRVLHDHSFVPPFEEARDYYMDWGRDEIFSLHGLSKGECGAGVIEMIEADISSAEAKLRVALEKNYDHSSILEAVILSARALLVVKGVDPKSNDEVIDNFQKKFVESSLVSEPYRNFSRTFEALNKGNLKGEEAYTFAESFLKEIKRLYSSMDPQFYFPGEKKEEEVKKEVYLYDLRGTPCPINYVKAKNKLKELRIGDVLELYLDEGEPVENVPVSLERDGHKILQIEKKENYYRVLVKRNI